MAKVNKPISTDTPLIDTTEDMSVTLGDKSQTACVKAVGFGERLRQIMFNSRSGARANTKRRLRLTSVQTRVRYLVRLAWADDPKDEAYFPSAALRQVVERRASHLAALRKRC